VFVGASYAKQGIERGATYALGVKTTLGSASLGLFSGKFGVTAVEVANPQGFTAPHLLKLGDAKVEVGLASLTKDTIRVPLLALDDVHLNLERKGGTSNYQVVLDHIEKLTGTEPSQKKLVIDELAITNVKVHADLLGIGGVIGEGQPTKVDVLIPPIKLTGVGKTGTGVGGTGVTVAELSSIIVQALMAAVVENGNLPKELLDDLRGQLGELDGLVDVGVQVGGKAIDAAKELGQNLPPDVQRKLDEAAEKAKKELEGLGGKIGDVLGGADKKKGGG
jgi:hypothetical protein